MAWAREHIANYKVPRRVELVDALAAQTRAGRCSRTSSAPATAES